MAVDPAVERAIKRFADAHNGDVTLERLRAAGLTSAAIKARVASGRLFHICHRVYCTADPSLLPLAYPTAVLLSIGDGAVLSHRDSVALRGWAERDHKVLDVTLVGRRIRPRPGVRLHYVGSLHPADVAIVHNVRVTAPARALIEFAGVASEAELSHAFGEARVKGRLTDAQLGAALGRAPRNHPGARIVRDLQRDGGTYDRAATERKLRRLLREAGLPQPRTNVPLHGAIPDFLWPEHKLILEVDGYGGHGHRFAFEDDRRRDQILVAAGYTVIRITARQLEREPMAVIVRLAQALARRAA